MEMNQYIVYGSFLAVSLTAMIVAAFGNYGLQTTLIVIVAWAMYMAFNVGGQHVKLDMVRYEDEEEEYDDPDDSAPDRDRMFN